MDDRILREPRKGEGTGLDWVFTSTQGSLQTKFQVIVFKIFVLDYLLVAGKESGRFQSSSFSRCLCVCVRDHGYACGYMCLHVLVEARGQYLLCSLASSHLFFETWRFIEPELINLVFWLARAPGDPPISVSLILGLQCMLLCLLLCECDRPELGSSCLCNRHFTP